jgi:anti-sigma factor RsiW
MNHSEAVRSSATERYMLGEMPEVERYAFEDHYFDCPECAEDVRTGALMREGVKAGLLDRSNVRSITRTATAKAPAKGWRSWERRVVVPWATAAGLALVIGFQAMPPFSRELMPQTLAPITLRPASRSGELTVELPTWRNSAITLAVELNAPPDTELSYDVQDSAGESVLSGRTAAPPAGAPMLLLFAVWTLSPDEHYILTVRRAADAQLIDEYRFTVARR